MVVLEKLEMKVTQGGQPYLVFTVYAPELLRISACRIINGRLHGPSIKIGSKYFETVVFEGALRQSILDAFRPLQEQNVFPGIQWPEPEKVPESEQVWIRADEEVVV